MTEQKGYHYARGRAGAVVGAMLDGGASVDAAAKAGLRTFDDAMRLALGDATAKAATAALFSRENREKGFDLDETTGKARAVAPATHYADRKEVSGALVKLEMRVRRQGSSAPRDTPGPMAPDMCAGAMEAARGSACRDLREAIASFRSGKNGAAKDAAKGKIRAILHTFEGDSIVTSYAVECGWKV